MKYLALLCFRDINQKQKEISNELLNINTSINRAINDRIREIQINKINQLPPEQKSEVMNELTIDAGYSVMIDQATQGLNIDDPTTEPFEMQLGGLKIEQRVITSRKVENIITRTLGDFDSYYNWLKRLRENALDRNKILREQHIDHVKTGIELNKLIENSQGSLIDDYADTSTEMPSYMDPED